MKRIVAFVLGLGVVAGLGWYSHRPKPQVVVAETADAQAAPADLEALNTATPPPVQQVAVVAPIAPAPIPRTAVQPAKPVMDAAWLSGAVELLISPQASFEQRQAVWKQLRETGKLDPAIGELEHRMAEDPHNAVFPATLGKAYLEKCATISDTREQGILAMQADKVFDTALYLDPNNWDARFTKAVALTYWPATLNKGEEMLQHFQTLIQQQEAQVPQPHFAQTYLWLGEQYHKAGREDDARNVWERGANLFPASDKLRARLAGAN
jgi:tetratricopeptide (TPR) repeat protein